MQESVSRRAMIVEKLRNLDISTKRELQDVLRVAALICKTPMVLITLLDDTKQHIQFKIGLDAEETALEDAFCKHTIVQHGVMEVKDSLLDQRFSNNPLVMGYPFIRFYAGSSLKAQSGQKIGSLCVIDQKPNELTGEQKEVLEILSQQVSSLLDLELSLKKLQDENEKARNAETMLKGVFESSPTARLLVDKEGIIQKFNRSAATFIRHLTNKSLQEGACITDLLNETLLPLFRRHIEDSLTGKQAYLETDIDLPGRPTDCWSLEFTPVNNSYGDITGVSIGLTDLTERNRHKVEIPASVKA